MPPPTAPRTFRIRKDVLDELDRRASGRLITANQLVNQMLYRELFLEVLFREIDALTVGRETFEAILNSTNTSGFEEAGRRMATIVPVQLFALHQVEADLQSYIYALGEVYGKICGWFSFKHQTERNRHRLIVTHDLGPNWSAFLKGYIGEMLRKTAGEEPKIVSDEHTLTFEVHTKSTQP
ncbi:MAG: hypothetical protein M1503_10900 [Thaumarchaeota archaeon]|nr:hypothetical protein [Nitrososphaerota archaeon]MCL5318750.1 hypothetical protein [Nitrososphaerota archaeon]